MAQESATSLHDKQQHTNVLLNSSHGITTEYPATSNALLKTMATRDGCVEIKRLVVKKLKRNRCAVRLK